MWIRKIQEKKSQLIIDSKRKNVKEEMVFEIFKILSGTPYMNVKWLVNQLKAYVRKLLHIS